MRWQRTWGTELELMALEHTLTLPFVNIQNSTHKDPNTGNGFKPKRFNFIHRTQQLMVSQSMVCFIYIIPMGITMTAYSLIGTEVRSVETKKSLDRLLARN
ncbi:hypothetical protein DPMN_156817 [Dreissena polymorpha]|uniref:Uncharacterized protein n=1 Tax=Dreissena polymorpha TaxID=45954 RepID=A0A9D4FUY6_DREPO|nr:hypothetical protein DPMN_156817 [Dreissena polymorpha]